MKYIKEEYSDKVIYTVDSLPTRIIHEGSGDIEVLDFQYLRNNRIDNIKIESLYISGESGELSVKIHPNDSLKDKDDAIESEWVVDLSSEDFSYSSSEGDEFSLEIKTSATINIDIT